MKFKLQLWQLAFGSKDEEQLYTILQIRYMNYYKLKFITMKKNIIKMLIASMFIVLAILNFSINTKSDSGDTNLIQQAQADPAYWCAEYYGGGGVCCITSSQGECYTGWGDYDGPYYEY